MAVRIRNQHERLIGAPHSIVAPLLTRLGGPDDVLWPAPAWAPMILDGPPEVGADGGHGAIRYRVSEVEYGRIRFQFHSVPGIAGYHEVSVGPHGTDAVLIRHVLECGLSGWMRIVWPTCIAPLHDAVLEDLLDNAEQAATGRVMHPARWTLRVRVLRALVRVPVRAAAIPADAILAARVRDDWAGTPGALVDAFRVPLWRGHCRDPQHWADAIFGDPPTWVRAALALRQTLVGLVGIEKGTSESFATRDRTDSEVLIGEDASHLRFRASVLVSEDAVTVSTVAAPSNVQGRIYLAAVRRVHPAVIRAMLRRAHRLRRGGCGH